MEEDTERLEERVAKAVAEEIALKPYDPGWPDLFRAEKEHLEACLPKDLIGRIEHFGSTAVPGMTAKPVIDMLVEVRDLEETKTRIVPELISQGYDYFWRPTFGDDGPPFYAWFIRRGPGKGERTHHIHMVEAHFSEHWDRLLFRDYLIGHPEAAREYAEIKLRLAKAFPRDRAAYTRGKTEFVERVTELAKALRRR
ncbi:MAG: GrpB family protein [Desulfobacteraceae bacterium]|nr:GrpB family protein [Desulfobacteraceae bacterium]